MADKKGETITKVLKRLDKTFSFGGDDIVERVYRGRNGNGK